MVKKAVDKIVKNGYTADNKDKEISMKRISFPLIGFASLFLLCVPLFGQTASKSIETFLLDGFDAESAVNAPGHTEHGAAFSWTADGSRYVTADFPKIRFVPGIPNALRVTRAADAPDAQVLGVQVKFDRKADNWVEIFPADADGNAYGVPMLTSVLNLDFWVWGAGYNYTLEVLVRDTGGIVHVLPAVSLKFTGWKNIILNIPAKVQQKSRQRSAEEVLRFVGFRVRTSPLELVDDYTIFFDQIKYTSSILEDIYDGYDLRKVDFGDEEGTGQ
jgi:hypothetical protein